MSIRIQMRLALLTFITLFFLGCGASLDAPLSSKLSSYETAYQQCNDFIEGKEELTTDVETECDMFIKRLNQVNDTAVALDGNKLKKGERLQKKTLY